MTMIMVDSLKKSGGPWAARRWLKLFAGVLSVSAAPGGQPVVEIPSERGCSPHIAIVHGEFDVEDDPVEVAVTPDKKSICENSFCVYVTNQLSNTVSVIATASNTVKTTFPVGTGPGGVAIAPCFVVASVGLACRRAHKELAPRNEH